MKAKILTLLFICPALIAIAQIGPGGVGNSTNNVLWLNADIIAQGDNTALTSWSDLSGNNNHATQGNTSYHPRFETDEINGQGVVRFDGIDDYLDDVYSYNARTVFAVYQILSANQAGTDLRQLWGNYDDGVHVALNARNNPGTWSFDADNRVTNTGRFGLNGAAYSGFLGNPGSPN
ncbi:MAG: hypothetical protein JXR07_00070 [Reichenbachiella sp.]